VVNRCRRRGAFTFIEVVVTLVVVTLVALLLYQVAAKSSTTARGAVANLGASRVVLAQQNYAAAHGGYTTTPGDLVGIGRDLDVTTGQSTSSSQVSMAVSASDTLVVAVYGSDSMCYVVSVQSLLLGAKVTESTVTTTCAASLHLPPGEALA
jgi:type II secretory pathway pseudopilin PulG